MILEFAKHVETVVASLNLSGASRNLYAGDLAIGAPDTAAVIEEPFNDIADDTLPDQVVKTFKVVCRGEIDNYPSATALARTVFKALHGKPQVTLPVVDSGPTYLCNFRCTTPASLGKDDKMRSRCVIYVYCTTQETVAV